MFLKMVSILILFTLAFSAFGQSGKDDLQGWSWVQVEGSFEDKDAPKTDAGQLLYSMEFHYRLKNNISDYSQLILRPMIGYKSGDATVWLGVAYFDKARNNGHQSEYRVFQMLSYSKRIDDTPIVIVANTRLEERILDDHEEMNFRLRQGLKVSIDLFEINQSKLKIYFQDQVFFNLNSTDWGGRSGYTQNRASVGLELQTKFGNTPVTFTGYYMRSNTANRSLNVIGLGAKIKIPHKKKSAKKNY